MTVAPKLVGFVIEDHYAGCNERSEFAEILTRKFVGFGRIGVSIALMVFQVGGYTGCTADTEALEVARKVYVCMGLVRVPD